MKRRVRIKVHRWVGGSCEEEQVVVPRGGSSSCHHKEASGSTLLVIRDRRGRRVRVLQLRQADRIETVISYG